MKKVLSLVLVAAMAVGMATTTFAAKTQTYDGMVDGLTLGYSVTKDTQITNYPGTGSTNLDAIEFDDDIYPMDEVGLNLNLDRAMFTIDEAGTIGSNSNLSATEIRNSKIAARTTVKGGSKVVKPITMNAKDGRVEVRFVDEFVSTKSQDVEIYVYLTVDGKRQDDNGITIIGTVANPETEVYADYDYVETAGGYVAVAEDFVPKVEVDLGNGVYIYTKFFKGKKYYGTASRDADDADDIVFSKYPDIDNVVTLKTVGLNSTGDIVKIDTDYSEYYVYDKDLNYLGLANEMLPYSTKYYLANRKLDVDAATEEPAAEPGEIEEPAEIQNPPGGGDVTAPNVNANPGTGC